MTLHRDREEAIALLLDQRPDPFSLRTDDDGQIDIEIEIVDPILCLSRSTIDPDPFFFEMVDRRCNIDHAGNGHMGSGSGRGFDHSRSDSDRPVFRDDHSLDFASQGGADEGSQILRVLDSVEDEKEGLYSFFLWSGKNLFEVRIGSFLDDTDDVLMEAPLHHLIKSFSIRKGKGDIPLLGEIENRLEGRGGGPGRNQNLLKAEEG